VPLVHAVHTLQHWLKHPGESTRALLLSLREDAIPLRSAAPQTDTDKPVAPIVFLSGPEGGLSAAEEQLAIERGFAPVTLGTRVLRAETAALAALAVFQI
jgi:16S rRNA (uracil1498-N3)-methyltransferase